MAVTFNSLGSMRRRNEYDQEVGFPVANWKGRRFPEKVTIAGDYCVLEPLDCARHAEQLFEAFGREDAGSMWTYLPVGPFRDAEEFQKHVRSLAESTQAVHFAIVNRRTGRAMGSFCLTRIDAENGVAEVGLVVFSPGMQKTVMSTEAHYLLLRHAFESLQYRRLEWKCDVCNEPSKRAALRLGFQHEGMFRQTAVWKGVNRNHHWFSIIDAEWETCSEAFRQWLCDANFENGKQKRALVDIRNGC